MRRSEVASPDGRTHLQRAPAELQLAAQRDVVDLHDLAGLGRLQAEMGRGQAGDPAGLVQHRPFGLEAVDRDRLLGPSAT